MLTTDARHNPQTIRRAAQILHSGGLVVFPTETVYGIAAWAANSRAMDALRTFKGRPVDQPFTVHLPNAAAAGRYVGCPKPWVRRLIERTLPGPVTLILDVPEALITDLLGNMGLGPETRPNLYHENTIGLRCPDLPIAREVLALIDGPVVASSANRRGQPPPRDAQEAAQATGQAAEIVIDGGRCRFAKPSTVIRVGQQDGRPEIRLERSGVYDERMIRRLIQWTVVMVCSGNTCRSPMAAAMAKGILAKQNDIDVGDLETIGLFVRSAGAFTTPGMPASAEAVDVMRQRGIDVSQHRSNPLTSRLIREADVLYCMTNAHRQAAIQMVPDAQDKIHLLDPNGDVQDPIGHSPDHYRQCAKMIEEQLIQRLKESQP